jgi:hypothetical protein
MKRALQKWEKCCERYYRNSSAARPDKLPPMAISYYKGKIVSVKLRIREKLSSRTVD